ncbi:MAG: DUF4115 domain-containing protein [bacterium]|jgi:transcriptional regulator with XRE-family HTH domain
MKYLYKEIGEILKAKRIELGRDIATMAAETKILEKNIEAIEEGDVKAFFSPIYYDLFARSYAKELGFDADELFGSKIVEESPEPNSAAENASTSDKPISLANTASSSRNSRKGLWFIVGVLVVVALVVVLIFKGELPSSTEAEKEPPVETTPLAVADSSHIETDSLMNDSLEELTLEDNRLHLKITVKETCWFLIVADGDTVLMDNLQPGTMHDFTAINRFQISAGNPAGAEYKLNDTALKPLSPSGKPIRALEINHQNKASFFELRGGSQ